MSRFSRPKTQHENLQEAQEIVKAETSNHSTKKRVFGVKLDEDLINKVKRRAKEKQTPIQCYVENALIAYLSNENNR
ncbi:hypothetical protein [Glaesserella sp. 15-184]|uniref:Tyrosine recombinase n=1 Tax=Glaesserella parasuis TaxID=738 RepID=F1CNF9_GLAPU|nr:hypothetical protein [Glaesserella sp. 15-184]ADY18547.1 tyrosine recombinase [Glaesserella parasuis]AUI67220.1 hypothetical protein CJD39_11470 [Glaesserella sp. 15-184]